MNILLVEDDQLLGEGIQHALVKSGETITWLQDGQSALDTLVQDDYDLVLLDLGLPRKDGLAVLKELRQRGKPVPVMILTARDTVDDRVEGLDLGADDYLIKPFSLDELKARIRALHRRACGRADPVLAYKNIELNPARHSVAYKDEDVWFPGVSIPSLRPCLNTRAGYFQKIIWNRPSMDGRTASKAMLSKYTFIICAGNFILS